VLKWSSKVAVRKTLRLLTGFALIIVGLLGLLLPVMPGWIFVIPGLLILADFFPPVRRLVNWAKARARAAGVSSHGGDEEKKADQTPPSDSPPPAI